jgi:3'(2'), 5'-bisphosphate nucleotidase
MDQEFIDNLGNTAIKAAIQAGVEILEIYNNNSYQVEYKTDNSPITIADKKAHEIISTLLTETHIPILSEEGADIPYNIRGKWNLFWLVDPIDGTKEFINRNGEFTVNIALIENCKPIFGVIYIPVSGKLYFGSGKNAYFYQNLEKSYSDIEELLNNIEIYKKKLPIEQTIHKVKIAASRSNLNPETKKYIENIENQYQNTELVHVGSSIKFCLISEGTADIYPRFSTTMEWDTAAGHVIVNASGGTVVNSIDNTELVYNKRDLRNPWFIVKNNLIS